MSVPAASSPRPRPALEDGVLIASSALFLLGTFAFPDTRLAIVWSLPYVLLAPGLALVRALWPHARAAHPIAMSRPRRLVLAFLADLVVVPGLSVILSQSPIGLSEASSALMLTGWTMSCLLVSALRRRMRRITVPPAPLGRRPFPLPAIVIAILVVSAGATILVRVSQGNPESYTEMYVLDGNQTAYGFPTTVRPGSLIPLTLVVVSHERDRMAFTLDAADTNTNTSSRVSLLSANVSIEPGGTISFPIGLAPADPGQHVFDARLMASSLQGSPYREVRLWVNVE